VLTISKEYFRLRKGMERRLYEIARKHCGKQTNWKISLALLHKKSGSSGTVREFRRKIKGIAKSDHMPDYRIVYDEAPDQVTFYTRSAKGHLRAVKDVLDKPKQGVLL